jgi:hypothetical protein
MVGLVTLGIKLVLYIVAKLLDQLAASRRQLAAVKQQNRIAHALRSIDELLGVRARKER